MSASRQFNPLAYPICLTLPERLIPGDASEHTPFAMLLMQLLAPAVAAEAGTETGVVYMAFCQAAEALGLETRCYALGDALHWGTDPLGDDFLTFQQNRFERLSHVLPGRLEEGRERFADGEIDLLHINGVSPELDVSRVFADWLPKVSRQGIVLISNISGEDQHSGAAAFWETVQARYPTFQFTHGDGLGVIAVGDVPESLAWLFAAELDEQARIRAFFGQVGASHKPLVKQRLLLDRTQTLLQDREYELKTTRATLSEVEKELYQTREVVTRTKRQLTNLQNLPLIRLYWKTARPVVQRYRRWKEQRRARKWEQMAGTLHYHLETPLPEEQHTGKGIILILRGWCFHPRKRITVLEISVNGQIFPVDDFTMMRRDVMQVSFPHFDQGGHSLLSGFMAFVPLPMVHTPTPAPVILRAKVSDGRWFEQELGQIDLLPGFGADPVEVAWDDGQGRRVAICMTTFNPDIPYFARQIESIRQQTHRNWVCIIHDDSSDANFYQRIQEIVSGDARFHLFRNEKRLNFYRNFERCLTRVPRDAELVALADQDDVWYPDKVAALAAEFQGDVQLAFSDMDIIDGQGTVLSNTYWTSRRNNYTDLATLLLANTVTGAASMFRADLLPDILPFPEFLGTSYHDHWIAAAALVKGRLGYVDRPLHGYRQHGSNVFGHTRPMLTTLFPWLRPVLARHRIRSVRKALHTWRRTYDEAYLHYLAELVLVARTLALRFPSGVAPEKLALIRRFGRFNRSLTGFLHEATRARVRRQPTLGMEFYGIYSLLNRQAVAGYYGLMRGRVVRRWRKVAPPPPSMPSSTTPSLEPQSLPSLDSLSYGRVRHILQNTAPLLLDISPEHPRRVNVLLSTINFRYVYGGYIGMFRLALQLHYQGYQVRILLLDETVFEPEVWREQIQKYPGVKDLFDHVEIEYRFDRSQPLAVSPEDTFIATSCWSAHVAHHASQALGQERFTFFVQEFEPMFFPMSAFYAITNQSYIFPHDALFSTHILQDYFRENRLGVYAWPDGDMHSAAFENTIPWYLVDAQKMRRTPRRLLFYARPEEHASRNLFEVGVLALSRLVREEFVDRRNWVIHGIGSLAMDVRLELAPGIFLEMLPRTTLDEYIKLLPSYDVGVSLMLTPHPSLVPLDMAAAGMLTVTNTFANKDEAALKAISSNLIPVPPTVDGIKQGVMEAMRRVDNYPARVAGSHIHWARTWEESFNPAVMAKLSSFLDAQAASVRQREAAL